MRDRLLAAAPKLVTLDSLVKRFLQMTKQRTASLLDPWLNDVDIANFGPLIGFANGLRNDYAAVSNGLSLSGVKVRKVIKID